MFIPPEPAQPKDWKFVDELKAPLSRKIKFSRRRPLAGEADLGSGLSVEKKFPDPESLLDTAWADFDAFLREAGMDKKGGCKIVFEKAAGFEREAFRIDVRDGSCVVSAGDVEGMRRAVYFLEDMIASSEGPFLKIGATDRKPFVKTRVSRCFFGPIKRPPFNRDELMDDVDYYPDEYLNKLAHEGVNGLWLTITFKDLCRTSITPEYAPDAEKRFSKLRRTIDKCRRYGIKIYVFCIEPAAFDSSSPVLKRHPEMGGIAHGEKVCFCPFSDTSRRYLREAVGQIFKNAPGLGGLINISLGERLTNCLNLDSLIPSCPRCAGRELWQIHHETMSAMEQGMSAENPDAEIISWLYVPLNNTGNKKDFVGDIAEHVPENVILQYNFESGGEKEQLNKNRFAGDYWLSYAGPSGIFKNVAEKAVAGGGRMSAKLQVGCSHEVASIPFVPVPSQLFKKYREMRKLGVSAAMQCWYFGNYPGLMNKAAGELSFEPFPESEEEFLLCLAAPEWGRRAPEVVDAWKCFADAYENYPVNVMFQYYGPMHDGVVWPLHLRPEGKPLCPTWKLDYPPSGDLVRECFYDSHTFDEMLILCRELSERWGRGVRILKSFADEFKDDHERTRDIGLAEALGIQFASGFNILKFYWLREKLWAPETFAKAELLLEMRGIVEEEIKLSRRMIELCEEDPRLGYHSEAEGYKYFPEKIRWRAALLENLLQEEFPEVLELVEGGGTARSGDWVGAAEYACGSGVVVGRDTFSWKADSDGSFLDIEATLSDLPGRDVSQDMLQVYLQPFPEWPVLMIHIWADSGMSWVNLGPKERVVVSVTKEKGGRVARMRFPFDYVPGLVMKDRVRFNILRSFTEGGGEVVDSWLRHEPLKFRLAYGDANTKSLGILEI